MATPSGPSLFEQTLATARYEGVDFPYVTPMKVEGGHHFVPHKAYRRRGADQEWTGQSEYQLPLRAAMLNDLIGFPAQYPDNWFALLDKLESAPIGELWHPSKGVVTVAVLSWTEEMDADVQNGLFVDIVFAEHNASVGLVTAPDGSPLTSTSDAQAANQATNADAAATAFSSTTGLPIDGYAAMLPLVTTMLGSLSVFGLTPTQVLGAIGPVLAAITANEALSVFATSAASATITALEDLRVTVYAIQSKLASPIVTQTYIVTRDAPLWQIAQLATGDIGNAGLIATFNVIPDPSRVRTGTALRIPVFTT